MLKSMRKNAKYFYFLFFLIILTFVFWGVGRNDNSQRVPLAVIDGHRISAEEYWRTVDNMDNVYRDAYGKDYTEEMRNNVREEVLNRMIQDFVLTLAAERAGLTVTDAEVEKDIMSTSAFQVNGAFSSKAYKWALRNSRTSPVRYEESVRRSILVKKMRSVIEDAVVVDTSEIEGLSGDPEIAKTLKQAMVEQKKQAAVASYVNGLMRSMDVTINRDIIS
jgi:hypothetical protein